MKFIKTFLINHKEYPNFLQLGNNMTDSVIKLKQMERLELRLDILIIIMFLQLLIMF